MKGLGEKIREARKARGLKQEELARSVPCSVDTVRRWEAGAREPRASEVKALSKALNVAEGELLLSEAYCEVRLILDKEGSFMGRLDFEVAEKAEKYVGVSKKGIVLHLAGPVRDEKALDAMIEEFRAVGLDALRQQVRWLSEEGVGESA